MTLPFPKLYLNLNFNGENLVVKLAYEHHDKEVNSLIAEGGSKKDAIYGYAWGGHFDKVETLYSENKDLIPFAVAGYCRGGFGDKVLQLISAHPGIEEEIKKNAVYGYAQAGNKTQVLLALKSSSKYLLMAILGASSTNQKEWLTELLTGTKFYPQAIQEAAKNGHFTLYKYLINCLGVQMQPAVSMDKETLNCIKYLNIALKGCISGAHIKEVAHLISLGANPAYAVNELFMEGAIMSENLSILLAPIHSAETRQKIVSIVLNTDQRLDPALLDVHEIMKLTINSVNDNKLEAIISGDERDNNLEQDVITVETLKNIIIKDQEDNMIKVMK
ncbi:MAG: hypothetical protein Q8M40_05225 [Legionella sp.]|nr:hypothetical protein [Legionella sp.]